MIYSTEARKGVSIELDGQPYRVLDYQHQKIGRGSAQVKLKLRDLRAGHIIERTFQASEKFTQARLDRRNVQYLYEDGGLYYFMDTESFEQSPLSADQLGEAINYIKEGMTVELASYKGEPVGVELPTAVQLKVVETGSSFKGETASPGTKPATLETGIVVQVPPFVRVGDVIKVDTRSGEYLERAG